MSWDCYGLDDISTVSNQSHERDTLQPQNDSNFTGPVTFEKWSIGLLVFQVLIVALIVTLNSLVLVVLICERSAIFCGIKYIFMCSLAFGDLLIGGIYTYYLLARSLHVAPSMAFCIKMMGFITCSVYVSILSFAACALDQYVAIVHPFAYARLASNRLAVGSVVGIWLLSLVVGLLPAMGWSRGDATKCSIYEVVDAPYTILMVSVSYYMTAPLIISLYARTFVVARRHIKAISAQASALAVGGAQRPTQQPNVRKELDVAVTIFIAVVVFLISWFPFTTAVFVNKIVIGKEVLSTDMTGPIGIANSFYNPIIYMVRGATFRRVVLRYCCAPFCSSVGAAKPSRDMPVYRNVTVTTSTQNVLPV